MIGARIGARIGPVIGARVGVGVDELGGGTAGTWTIDATSGIATPASSTEWQNFITAKGLSISAPDALWLFQEASGNPADSIGTFALTASGAPSYQVPVSGWARKAITFVDAATGALKSTSASLPNLNAASAFQLGIVVMPASAPAGTRCVQQMGANTTRASCDLTTTPRMDAFSAANTALGTVSPINAVRLVGTKSDHTNSLARVYTDQEKLSPTFGLVAGQQVGWGAGNNPCIAGGPLYGALWTGAKAEAWTDAVTKAVYQAMGLTIPWT